MKNMIKDIKKLVSKYSVWFIYLSYSTYVKECGHYVNINGERWLYYGTAVVHNCINIDNIE